jgi:8-oxo-dGTP diphosphatase
MNGLAHRFAPRARIAARGRRQPIAVAACIVRDAHGRILMARRRPDQMSPGTWEIPGGKIEPGEDARDAAARELKEETGLDAHGLRPFTRYTHDFGSRSIDLELFCATGWSGAPVGRENQALDWVRPGAAHVAPVLSSNTKALRLLSLPRSALHVTSPHVDTRAWARDTARRASTEEWGAVLLGGRHLPPSQQFALAARLRAALERVQIPLWIDAAPGVAVRVGAELAAHCTGNGAPRGSGLIHAAIDPSDTVARAVDVIFLRAGTDPPTGSLAPVYVFAPQGAETGPDGCGRIVCDPFD